MHKSYIKPTIFVAALAAGAALHAGEEVLHLDLDIFAGINYEVDGFNVKEFIETQSDIEFDNDAEFESAYPIFDDALSYDVNGFGVLEYYFSTFDVAPTFDLYETYDWEIYIEGEWGYDVTLATGSSSPPVNFADDGEFGFGFPIPDLAVSDVTLGLTGLTPHELVDEISTFLAPLPPAGTVTDLLAALDTEHGISLGWPLVSIDPGAIEYYTDFGLPDGRINVALHDNFELPLSTSGVTSPSFIDSLLSDLISANAGVGLDIHIAAQRRVPDSGSTFALILLALGLTVVAKRGHGRKQ